MTMPVTDPPVVTIGILTHNYGRYLPEAVDSVLAQTRSDWELVICDDASTDDTPQIVAQYLSDPRVSYVRHEKNLGQAGNWASALRQGTAPFVAVLHADDAYLPETLATVLPLFENGPDLDLVYGNWWVKREGSRGLSLGKQEKSHLFTGHDEFRYQSTRNTLLPSVAFLSRHVICETGLPNTGLKPFVDFEYFLRVCLKARRVQALATPLAVYRVHGANASAITRSDGSFRDEQEKLFSVLTPHVAPYPGLTPSLHALRRKQAEAIFSAGITAMINDDPVTAVGLMRRGLRLDRGILRQPKLLLDRLLCFCGGAGLSLLRRLHRSRLEVSSRLESVSHV